MAAADKTRRDAFDGIAYADVVGVVAPLRGEPRAPSSAQERFAAGALMALTSDCDGAKVDDGVGFNKADTNAGRYLGHWIARGGDLDDVEWQGAIDMLPKYHGQVGRLPAPDEADLARRARLLNDEAFKERLGAVLREAKRVRKAREQHQLRLTKPDIEITREGAEREDGGVWVVSAPYCEEAVQAWRNLHREFGGGWSMAREVRIVPYRGARALHALLTTYHVGQYARGLKGVYVIGSTVPPVRVEDVPPVAEVAAPVAEVAAPVVTAPTRAVTTVSEALEVLADPTSTPEEIEAALALLR